MLTVLGMPSQYCRAFACLSSQPHDPITAPPFGGYTRRRAFGLPKGMLTRMSIGFGIFLFVVGAILAFALNFQVDWIDLDLVGYLLMGAGALIFIIGLVLAARKRQSITTVRSGVDGSGANVQQRRTETTPDQTH